jgi:hypothetical protein
MVIDLNLPLAKILKNRVLESKEWTNMAQIWISGDLL